MPDRVKKAREFHRAHRVVLSFGFLVLLYIVLCISFVLGLIYSNNQPKEWWEIWSIKGSILNLYEDFGGFMLAIIAGLFAAYEFQEARKAAERIPDLKIEEKDEGSSVVFAPNKLITVMLKNEGTGIAQHFLVELEIPTVILVPGYYDPDYRSPALQEAFMVSGGDKYWVHEPRNQDGLIFCRYYNRGDFPCFDQDQIPLANFRLTSGQRAAGIGGKCFDIKYSIKSEKMKEKTGTIRVSVPPDIS